MKEKTPRASLSKGKQRRKKSVAFAEHDQVVHLPTVEDGGTTPILEQNNTSFPQIQHTGYMMNSSQSMPNLKQPLISNKRKTVVNGI